MKKTQYALKASSFLVLLIATIFLDFGDVRAYALIDLNYGDANTTSSSSSNTSVDIETRASAEVQSETAVSEGEEIKVGRNQISTEDEGSVVISAKAVLTNSDLRAYADSALRSDKNLEEVNFKSNRVEVKYKETGKFLALVPITFTVKAVANANGEVELNYPWYAFLTVDNEERLETELKVAVDNALRARTVGSVRAEGEVESPFFTASESAEVAGEMHAILKSGLVADISQE